jgi:CubicO group peptidase (beta-lactamase class C family)
MTAQVHGTCDPRFEKVKSLFQSYLETGEELGASLCVNIDGTDVLDLWGGYADAARTKPWETDTITCIWSSTKIITALALLICIDRGLVDPNEKVSKYWPEFAANGKEGVEVRHMLSHATGLSGWQESVTMQDVCDLEKTTNMLVQQAPWWEPGTASGYHAFTMGHLIAGLIQKVTNLPIDEFVKQEITGPLGADFQFGANEKDWSRTAEIVPPPPMTDLSSVPPALKDPSSIAFRTIAINPGLDAKQANEEMFRKAVIPAGNGFSNARGLVRILSAIALSSPENASSFLSQKTVDRIFTTQQHGPDLVVSIPVRFGLGLALSAPGSMNENLPEGKVGSWGGWGGSQGIVDAERKVTIGYVMNKMENAGLGPNETGEKKGMGNYRMRKYLAAIYEALGVQ